MRRVLRNSSEVFHFWANQTQEYGECGNVHFKGPILRSYRAEIGNIINPKTALITNRKWSITTSGHTSAAASAASHLTRLYVYNPVPDCIKHHRENLNSIRDEISDAAEKERRARSESMKEWHARRRLEQAETFAAYIALFELEKMASREYAGVLSMDLDAIRAGIAAQEAAVAAERAAFAKRQRAAEHKRVLKWRAGTERGPLYWLNPVALRLTPDKAEVETSKGVKIPVHAARRLWGLINLAHSGGVDLTPDMKVNHVYSITRAAANGDLIIECHTIKYAESMRMAETLGLLMTGPGSGPAETETQSKGAGDEE